MTTNVNATNVISNLLYAQSAYADTSAYYYEVVDENVVRVEEHARSFSAQDGWDIPYKYVVSTHTLADWQRMKEEAKAFVENNPTLVPQGLEEAAFFLHMREGAWEKVLVTDRYTRKGGSGINRNEVYGFRAYVAFSDGGVGVLEAEYGRWISFYKSNDPHGLLDKVKEIRKADAAKKDYARKCGRLSRKYNIAFKAALKLGTEEAIAEYRNSLNSLFVGIKSGEVQVRAWMYGALDGIDGRPNMENALSRLSVKIPFNGDIYYFDFSDLVQVMKSTKPGKPAKKENVEAKFYGKKATTTLGDMYPELMNLAK